MGAIGIRALAGGALTGEMTRHPTASPPPEPIGSGPDYDTDLQRARLFQALVDEGYANSLAEAAMRFVTGNPLIATTLIGIASVAQFDAAASAVARGPLPQAALDRLRELQSQPA
jgi:aryl-alcohol dehydrogenase-like predicted oxidoreductase